MTTAEFVIEEHIEANVAECDRDPLLTIPLPLKVNSRTLKAKADESIILPATGLVHTNNVRSYKAGRS